MEKFHLKNFIYSFNLKRYDNYINFYKLTKSNSRKKFNIYILNLSKIKSYI